MLAGPAPRLDALAANQNGAGIETLVVCWTLAGRIHCTVLALSSLAVLAMLFSWRVFLEEAAHPP